MTAAVRSLRAGALYFALVFAAGFALGAFRVLVTAPRLGEVGAVLLELPVMLFIAWLGCGWLTRRFAIRGPERPAMGAVAFALLMAAELAMSMVLFDRTPAAHFAAYLTPAGALGLTGQVAFGLMPLVR
ncbi:MAG TPA: hypothetical protein VGS12_15080 [Caulobacteraceae bacterium]|nr:hypothetical protein [Caulobacteraceae bacterium]